MGEHGAMSCTARVYVAGYDRDKKNFSCVEAKYFPDSDDSDNEGGLGNVERVVMRPPGHSGKAKKGHLCFDAIYETGKALKQMVPQLYSSIFLGNLGRVDFINDYEYDLFVRPDTCNPRYRYR